jgi:hypothetical protein
MVCVLELLVTLDIPQLQKQTFSETRCRVRENFLASRTLKKLVFLLRGLILAIKTSALGRLQKAKMNILRAAAGRKIMTFGKRSCLKERVKPIMPQSNKLETTHRKEDERKY